MQPATFHAAVLYSISSFSRHDASKRETLQMNQRSYRPEKKDQREIRIVHVNVNKRESTGISLKGVSMCLSEMWQKNESLYDMHRRKRSMLFDFRQSSSSKTNASFVKDSEWNSKIKNVAKMTMKSSRNP